LWNINAFIISGIEEGGVMKRWRKTPCKKDLSDKKGGRIAQWSGVGGTGPSRPLYGFCFFGPAPA
jgi:hypothetical protein